MVIKFQGPHLTIYANEDRRLEINLLSQKFISWNLTFDVQ